MTDPVDINSLPYNRYGRNSTGKTVVYGKPKPVLPYFFPMTNYLSRTPAQTKSTTEIGTGRSERATTKVNSPAVVNNWTIKGGFTNKNNAVSPYVQARNTTKDKPTPKPTGDTKKPEVVNPSTWKWNLPPHRWSMPLSNGTGNGKDAPVNDAYRRGRLWWKMSDMSIAVTTGGGDKTVTPSDDADRKYGFQFLWNPEAFATTVAVQMDATPTAADRFLGGAGFFPATEGISFNIRLDRTNDFACAAANFARPDAVGYTSGSLTPATNYITSSQVSALNLANYYKHGGLLGSVSEEELNEKIVDLFQRGTLADVEYLYRAINGIGPSGTDVDKWVNGRGVATSDIGFLQPTLLNVDIGPLSYQGYVNNLSVTHTAFTRDMVPIRTDLTITVQLLATAGLQTGYSQQKAALLSEDQRKALNKTP